MINWSTDQLIYWYTDTLINWSIDILINWSTDQLLQVPGWILPAPWAQPDEFDNPVGECWYVRVILELWLGGLWSLLSSCSITTGALGRLGLLSSCAITTIPIPLHIIIILTSIHLYIYTYIGIEDSRCRPKAIWLVKACVYIHWPWLWT